jgi:iron complex outermembrane receptor protein
MPLRTPTAAFVPAGQGYDAAYNRTHTSTMGYGASLQLTVKEPVFEHANQFVAGVSYDGARSDFSQTTELATLTVDRGTQAGGPLLMGPGMQTDLVANNHVLGAYMIDTWSPTETTSIHISARFNWLQMQLNDRLGSALDGKHAFVRVNPALGFTQKLTPTLTLYAGYGESNRAPSAAELACADPDQPCRLPNAFISDPPLKQVVSRSVEIGLRGRVGPAQHPLLQGSLAAFGARNQNDILFVAGSHVGTGYFQNAGTTQRVGVEAGLSGELGRVSFYASYTLLRATFESELKLPRNAAGGGDDDDQGGSQQVEKGARIPGLPMHAVKAGVAWRVTEPLELSVSMLGQSSQPFRGDEANESPFVKGYVIMNAQASYRLFKELLLYVRAENLLNTKFDTFGVLANPSEVLPGARDPRFLGRGAPFGIWAGVVFHDQ